MIGRSRGKRLGGPPPRIAFLVDWLEDPYQSTLLAGAAAEAARRGVTLVALAGGILGGTTKNGLARNYLYDLVRAPHFDGAIVLAGTLGNQWGASGITELIDGFGGIPVVSIAVPLPGHSSVLVDNRVGMRRAIEHLVVEHGYRRIAFIRGPEVNAEAETRFRAYVEVLEEHGIIRDDALVLSGDFQREGGARAVRVLLDERNVPVESIDAIAAATDLMVMGAVDELERRGLRVPRDLGVVGFDDLEEVRYLSPPLTSVRQPLAEQGVEALRLLLGQLNGAERAANRTLETQFIRRRSCGCLPQEKVAMKERSPTRVRLSFGAELMRDRDVTLAEMTRAARGSFVGAERGWEQRLWSALMDEFGREEEAAVGEPFRSALERLLVQVLEAGGDVALGHDLVSAVRKQLWSAAGDEVEGVRRVEDQMHDARILISSLVERSQARARLAAQGWARLLGQVSVQLAGAEDQQDLGRRVASELPRLGLGFCVVLSKVEQPPEHVKVELAWAADKPSVAMEFGHVFPIAELLPKSSFDPDAARTVVVLPLTRPDAPPGYLVVAHGNVDGYAFEMLRELLCPSAQRPANVR